MMVNLRWRNLLVGILMLALIFPFAAMVEASGNDSDQGQTRHRVIITFKQKPGKAEMAHIQAVGGRVDKSYRNMRSLVVELTEEEIQKMSQDTNISAIEEDAVIESYSDQVPWGISSTQAPVVWSQTTGQGVRVAILDTGVDINHADLTFFGGYNTIDSSDYSGTANHGTHVSGIIGALANNAGIVGMAPQVQLYSVKVLKDDGSGSLSALIAGLDWAITNDMDIVNMSLGTSSDTLALRSAIDRAYAAGILLIAAAGNSGTADGSGDTVRYPAKYEKVVAVGAVNNSNVRASFSATGPDLELSAPGVSIYSTVPGSRYGSASGTSMAAPHVTGAAALIWAQNPKMNHDQVRAALRQGALNAGDKNLYGYGIINLSSWVEDIPDVIENPDYESQVPVSVVPDSNIEEKTDDETPEEGSTVPAPVNSKVQIKLKVGSKYATVSGRIIQMDVAPYLLKSSNRTMIPIRFVSENMGAKVEWDDLAKRITIRLDGQEVIMTIGSKNVKVNGVPCTTDVAPYIKNGRTFVPVRFISESIGAKVEYFSVTKEILITK